MERGWAIFKKEIFNWRKEIVKSNNLSNILNSSDDNNSSADVVDQASSYTDKTVEMKSLNRSRKLIPISRYIVNSVLLGLFVLNSLFTPNNKYN